MDEFIDNENLDNLEEISKFTIPVKYIDERLYIGDEDIWSFKTLEELREYIINLAQESY